MQNLLIKVRSNMLIYLTHNMALPLLTFIKKPQKFPYSSHQLKQFPAGSLGNDFINMLQEKKFELLPNYVKHDIKHLLLQYDPTCEDEVCLQCFMLGNGLHSFPVIAAVVYGFITMPECWGKFKTAYQRGNKSTCIKGWQLFNLLHQPTQSLIFKINNYEKK